MNLGTQTASLVNHIYSRSFTTDINVGDGATFLMWTDRKAATVIDVFTKGKYTYFTIQEDNVSRIDSNGMSDAQSYEYTPNPEGCTKTFRVTENGYQAVYVNPETGRFVNTSGNVIVGRRSHHHDYSF